MDLKSIGLCRAGSSPAAGTICGRSSAERTSVFYTECRGFESLRSRQAALVAQMDRVFASYAKRRWFDSGQGHHFPKETHHEPFIVVTC